MRRPAEPDSERVAGDLVRQARAEKRLPQRSLATAAGVPQSTIARIESGHMQPSLPLLYRLLAAAGARPPTDVPADDPDRPRRPPQQGGRRPAAVAADCRVP